MSIFPEEERSKFTARYPEKPHKLQHLLNRHNLMEFAALANLAENLPQSSIEYNAADQPIGISQKPGPTGIPIGETIRNIGNSGSWAVLKNIEQHPDYAALLARLIHQTSDLALTDVA